MRPGHIALVLALLALVIVTVVNKCGSGSAAAAPDPKAAMQPLSVSAVALTPSPLTDNLIATGSLLANNSVEVRNEVAGRLVRLAFEEGQPVEKGALLVKIYDDDLQAQLRKLTLDEEMAARTEARQKDLLGVNGVSQQEYDMASNGLNGIKADMDLLRAQIAKTEIRAPFSGVVGLRSVSEGAFLSAFTTIATLQQLDPMKLEFTVPERYRDRLHVKDTLTFQVGSDGDLRRASIYAFEPMVDPTTRSLKVRALCRNAERELLPGAFVKVKVPLSTIENALMVPTQAVIPGLRGQSVILCRDGKAVTTQVDIGLRNDTTVQLTSGVYPGDTVLVTGIMQARPGMPLRVKVISGTGQGK
ncbi:MAG: efflux RND transporter periplasmic adaptor subunit [Flavobacteriales bacterium]